MGVEVNKTLLNWIIGKPTQIEISLPVKQQEPIAAAQGYSISAVNQREQEPRWLRSYTANIERGIKLKINASSYLSWSRSYRGELTQANGNWVLFDPENPAEKIIDREIIAAVESVSAKAIALDKEYMASERNFFIDEKNHKWQRVGGGQGLQLDKPLGD